MLDDELQATGCISPTSQQGNCCLSLRPAVPRLTPRLAENQITSGGGVGGGIKTKSFQSKSVIFLLPHVEAKNSVSSSYIFTDKELEYK